MVRPAAPARAPASFAALVLVLVLAPSSAPAAELPRAMGMYPASGPALAMVDSKVLVTVRGPIAEVIVTQRFQNRGDHPTEATYVFPLPADAAVTAMSIRTGTRTIRGAIERRDDAQRRYEAAIRQGVGAGLLEQERPDVFTQTVAAIPAKGTVEVTLRYDTLARYGGGTWELVLPMVVAPRYVPGVATSRPTTGTGRSPDTDRAPDASRVTPPGGPGAGGATDVALRFADKVEGLASPTHELRVSGSEAAFTDPKTDHDAIVRWRAPVPATGWVEPGPDGGYAAVVVEAPAAAPRKGALRCLLVLDRSAASLGDAEAVARAFVRSLLAGMTAADRVAVAGSDQLGWSTPADAARAIDAAWQGAAGAFDLTRVLAAARPEGAPIVLVTGGLVADDAAAIAAAKKLGVPVHVIGVGSAPARGLLGGLASASGGTARFLTAGDDLAAAAKAALADAAAPPAPLSVTWGTLAASDVVPGTLPRLGAGQAAIVLARVRRAQPANARARGDLFAIEVLPAPRAVDGATSAMGPLARRWARGRLDELIAARAAPAAIAAHALQYGLVSPQTSLVAIGEEVVVAGGVKRSISVPVSVPAGMRWLPVKKQTTVDTTVTAKEPAETTTGTIAQAPVQTIPKPDPKPAAKPEPKRDGRYALDRDAERATKKKHAKSDDGDGDGDEDDDYPLSRTKQVRGKRLEKKPKAAAAGAKAARPAKPAEPRPQTPPPAPPPPAADAEGAEASRELDEEDSPKDAARKSVALGADAGASPEYESSGELVMLTGSALSIQGRQLRITAALGGGLTLTADRSAPLLSLSTRFELGRRTMFGVGASLWITSAPAAGAGASSVDLQGQVLATFARRGIARWLEVGGGLGVQLGAGTGPAAALGLRYHLPPNPRAAAYLKYDGALLFREGARVGQSAITLGLELGF